MKDQGHGWYQSTVNRVETGGRPDSFDEATALSLVLDFDLDVLTANDLQRAMSDPQRLQSELAELDEATADRRRMLALADEAVTYEARRVDLHQVLVIWPPGELTPEELAEDDARKQARDQGRIPLQRIQSDLRQAQAEPAAAEHRKRQAEAAVSEDLWKARES